MADDLRFRPAAEDDIPAILALLTDDPLGALREGGPPEVYREAFRAMAASPALHLLVGEAGGEIIATYQLAILPGLSERGRTRALLEAVRVAAPHRSRGIGERLLRDAMARATAAGAGVMELFTHRRRTRAHAFYDRLGFTPSHIGYKRDLTDGA